MSSTRQIFEVTRAPEARTVDEMELCRMIAVERLDSEWDVHEMVLEGGELLRKDIVDARERKKRESAGSEKQ